MGLKQSLMNFRDQPITLSNMYHMLILKHVSCSDVKLKHVLHVDDLLQIISSDMFNDVGQDQHLLNETPTRGVNPRTQKGAQPPLLPTFYMYNISMY